MSLLGIGAVPASAQTPALDQAEKPSVTQIVPSTVPAPAEKPYFLSHMNPSCARGYVCAAVPYQDAHKKGYMIFKFYSWRTYTLKNWVGLGSIKNSQVDNNKVRIRNGSGHRLSCVGAGEEVWNDYNWTPAWYIDVLHHTPC